MIERMPKKGGKTLSKQDVLAKAIKKAIKNGWHTTLEGSLVKWSIDSDDGAIWINRTIADKPMYRLFAEVVIYDHDFAKALWGELGGWELCGSYEPGKLWECRLQEMVVADDPIAYLAEHL